tara:strand:+ start:572 stop:1282 length:711 start_codon:yes stop_codon:yes gene_type:complete
MALHKLFPKFLFFGFTGLSAVTGLKYISPLISSNVKVNKNPGILVDTKNSTSTFNELLDSKIVLELLKTHKNNLLISAGGTLIGCGLLYKIGIGNFMYATRNQLKNGVISLTNNINNFKTTFQSYKKKVFEKLGYLDEKIDKNQKNIELVIKQKTDEMKCELKDLKSGQLKTNSMLDLMTDKINIIENQGKYISKGVYLLCNTVINNENFDNEHVEQLKIYNDFNNKKKVTDKNTL